MPRSASFFSTVPAMSDPPCAVPYAVQLRGAVDLAKGLKPRAQQKPNNSQTTRSPENKTFQKIGVGLLFRPSRPRWQAGGAGGSCSAYHLRLFWFPGDSGEICE